MTYSALDRADFKRLANKMSKAFRDSDGGGIVERFESVSKLLFIKIVDERLVGGTWPGALGAAQPQLRWREGDSSRTVYERARELWMTATGGKNAKVFMGSRSNFPKDVEAVARIVSLLQDLELDRVGVDVKGAAYEELLRDTFEKNDNQQYFTPRHLMDFVVGMTNPQAGSKVLDPASGSGGFLVGALNHVAAAGGKSLPEVYGVDIDERMAWVARINVFLHGGDPAAISHISGAGSLKPLTQIQHVLPKNGFSHILTNPPFGSDMTDKAALARFETGKGRATRRRGVLFMERCLELLQPGGVLAVIIDDSILNLDGNSDIRDILRQESLIRAVVSLPDVTFMPYSTAKSSLLIVEKRDKTKVQRQGPVFMADVENVGNRPNGDPLYQDVPSENGTRPLLSDLPEVLDAWLAYEQTDQIPASVDHSKMFLADIDQYSAEPSGDRLDVNYFHPTRSAAAEILRTATAPTYALSELLEFPKTSANPAEAFGDGMVPWIGLGDIEALSGEFDSAEMPTERIKSNPHLYQAGDILLSRLRPKLRKIIFVPSDADEGACSAELVVLRKKACPPVDFSVEYIAYMLRTDLAFGQQVFQITGVGRPRVGVDALKRLRLPVPESLLEQRRIVQEMDGTLERYRELKREADRMHRHASELLADAYSSSVRAVTSDEASATLASSSTALSSIGSEALAAS